MNFLNSSVTQKKDLDSTKKELAATNQTIGKVENEHYTLAADTEEALAKLKSKFKTRTAKNATNAEIRMAELESKLQDSKRLLFSDWQSIINLTASNLSLGSQIVPVVVKMSGYTTKKDTIGWYSDSFYTHNQGYKMCLYLEAGGWGNGRRMGTYTHLLVYLYLIKGAYDNQLRWPLKGHCEIRLLNQNNNCEHHLGKGTYYDWGHERVTSGVIVDSVERNHYPIWYSDQFISNKDLHNITTTHQYLKDDNIFLQVDYIMIR